MSDIKIPTEPSAKQWAECFEMHKKDNNWSIDDIDEGLMIVWFANFWACTADPLQDRIEQLEADISLVNRARQSEQDRADKAELAYERMTPIERTEYIKALENEDE